MRRRTTERVSFTNFRMLSKQLEELLPGLRSYVLHPRRIGIWLEEHNPWLSRHFLSAASNVVDPYIAGMGLRIENLSETMIEVVLPRRLRNRGEGGVAHVGALTTLAEFTSRLYWERHLNLNRHEMMVSEIQARFLAETGGETRAVFSFNETDREAVLFRLRSEATVLVPCQVGVYETDGGRLVAEITVEWLLSRAKELGAKPRS
jgi:acyl-coenzyme A thioesterase PaaI-like protein